MCFDCTTCGNFAMQPSSPAQPCGGTGAFLAPSPTQQTTGTRQAPLLYLMYQYGMQLLGPETRTVRATWRAPKYSKNTGKLLAYPKYTKEQSVVESEAQELFGMVLAQRVRILTVWGQLSREEQERCAQAIANMLQGDPVEGFAPSLEFELLNGTLYDPWEVQEVQKRIVRVQGRVEQLAQTRKTLDQRLRIAKMQGDELAEAREQAQSEMRAWRRRLTEIEARKLQLRMQYPILFHEGDLANDFAIQFALDSSNDRSSLETTLAEYRLLNQEAASVQEHGSGAENRYHELQSRLSNLELDLQAAQEELARTVEDLEWSLLIQPVWQEELRNKQQALPQRALEAQQQAQWRALKSDYALQVGNYANPQIPQTFTSLLSENSKAGAVRRQIFLFLHPRLKYTWTAEVACRFLKLLAHEPFLQQFDRLHQAHLIQPGPYAKLGIFVMNALTPGSYDSRHRAMVQSELDQVLLGMHEYGLGETITCHSCNSETFGNTDDRAWIRDHNPPTSLVELAGVCPGLGLPFYNDAKGGTGKQILLPQCMECSTRQGVITDKVCTLLRPVVKANQLGTIVGPLRDWIEARLEPADRDELHRLILNPAAAWVRHQPQTGFVKGNFVPTPLVTTGRVAGSFAGIDDDLLRQMGDQLGCHTCPDPAPQTDPFRNVSWIADHQPPTALVERGLMELPQIVYPHCRRCSLGQAREVRALCRIFDGCFGEDFKEGWVATLKEAAYSDL